MHPNRGYDSAIYLSFARSLDLPAFVKATAGAGYVWEFYLVAVGAFG
jgi:hypothetical protein